MRAIVDSNVLVSYLLNTSGAGAVGNVLGLVADGRILIALPPEQIEELRRAVATKPFLHERIALTDLNDFFSMLEAIGELLPPVVGDPPRVLRDRKDDYLIESAKQNKIDIIVSGDRDLLNWEDATSVIEVIAPADLERYLSAKATDYP